MGAGAWRSTAPRRKRGSADVPSSPLQLDERTGGAEWRAAVAGHYQAREAYLLAVVSGARPAPIARACGVVVSLYDCSQARASERDPVEEAGQAYREASIRLLATWAPNSTELREQMRLAAELMGIADPAGMQTVGLRDIRKVEGTPAELLNLLFTSSVGLWQAENRARRAGK
jgi:hypothetical protein